MKKCHKKIELPADFADQLLELQIEYRLSSPPSDTVTKQLIYLYSMGVSFYQSQGNHKYLYFQNKMKEVLSKIAQFYPQACNGEDKDNYCQQTLTYRQSHQKQLSSSENQITYRNIEKIFNQASIRGVELTLQVSRELQKQNQMLQRRLNGRKSRTISQRQASSGDLSSEVESKNSTEGEGNGLQIRDGAKQALQNRSILRNRLKQKFSEMRTKSQLNLFQ